MKRFSPAIWVGGIIVLAVLIGAGLEVGGVTHFFHKNKSPTNIISATKARNGTNNSTNSGATDTPSIKNPNGNNATGADQSKQPVLPGNADSSSTTLVVPYGQFVNFHKPASASSTEQSACNTSAGATCVISFTLKGVTKSLPGLVADGSGAAIWPAWTPKSIGLTSGSWVIKATATLNGQTKSTSDPKELVIP